HRDDGPSHGGKSWRTTTRRAEHVVIFGAEDVVHEFQGVEDPSCGASSSGMGITKRTVRSGRTNTLKCVPGADGVALGTSTRGPVAPSPRGAQLGVPTGSTTGCGV